MTRESFIRKWLANPQKQYNEQCRDEMRDDLDLVIETALRQTPVSGRSELLLAFLEYVDTIDLVKYDAMSHEDLIAGFEASNCHITPAVHEQGVKHKVR